MPLLLKKTPEADIKKHVLPLIYNRYAVYSLKIIAFKFSVCNENTRIQVLLEFISKYNIKFKELCLSIVPTVGKLIDRDAMKTQLLPKLLKLVLEGSILSVSV